MSRTALAILVLVGSSRAAILANTIWVDDDNTTGPWDGSPDHPYQFIQDGIDAAADGDEVSVAAGTYNETIDLGGKAITLRSAAGSDATTIDASGLSDSVVKCVNGEGADTVVQGFTITAGLAVRGGGMLIEFSDPMVDSCVFRANRAEAPPFIEAEGGGMHNFHSNPTVANCVFRENTAWASAYAISQGGGMYNESSAPLVRDCMFIENGVLLSLNTYTQGAGMYNIDSNPTVVDCEFTRNYTGGSSYGNEGGGMFNERSSPKVTGCTFYGNWDIYSVQVGAGMSNAFGSNPTVTACTFVENVGGFGPGMDNTFDCSPAIFDCLFIGNMGTIGGAMNNADGSAPTVHNCVFINNTAESRGGAMRNSDSSPMVLNSRFIGNAVTGAGIWRGGGAMSNGFLSSPIVVNCIFAGNSAPETGGAIFNFNGGNPTIINCSLSGNIAGTSGGAMYGVNTEFFESNAAVTNCILWENGLVPVVDESRATTTITYSNVEYGWTGSGGNNIDADPRFVDPASADYHLLPDSPCIDAGQPDFIPVDSTSDIDGQYRIWNGRVDMGADEFGSIPVLLGDMNCDHGLDAEDIDPFFLALGDAAAYDAAYPGCDVSCGDINGDGGLDAEDVDPFFGCLSKGGCE